MPGGWGVADGENEVESSGLIVHRWVIFDIEKELKKKTRQEQLRPANSDTLVPH